MFLFSNLFKYAVHFSFFHLGEVTDWANTVVKMVDFWVHTKREKNHTTPYGKIERYQFFAIFKLAAERITKAAAKEIIETANNHYGRKPYVWISFRENVSVIGPEAYDYVNHNKMVGRAIVSKNLTMRQQEMDEMEFYDVSVSFFEDIEQEKKWSKTIVNNHWS